MSRNTSPFGTARNVPVRLSFGLAGRTPLHQLLWFETLLKFTGGALLIIAPVALIRLLGLPRPPTGFWPRLAGALLLGLSAATLIEGAAAGSAGLGLGGCVAINLAAAGVVAVNLTLGTTIPARRGRAALWLLVVLLTVLAFVEIAFV